jgi:hypothetical protein
MRRVFQHFAVPAALCCGVIALGSCGPTPGIFERWDYEIATYPAGDRANEQRILQILKKQNYIVTTYRLSEAESAAFIYPPERARASWALAEAVRRGEISAHVDPVLVK